MIKLIMFYIKTIAMRMKRKREKDENYVQISVLVTQAECDIIDFAWRSDLKYASRADYIRNKLGLETWR